jgi:hypothetical protein
MNVLFKNSVILSEGERKAQFIRGYLSSQSRRTSLSSQKVDQQQKWIDPRGQRTLPALMKLDCAADAPTKMDPGPSTALGLSLSAKQIFRLAPLRMTEPGKKSFWKTHQRSIARKGERP